MYRHQQPTESSSIDVEFPLHPATHCPEDVSALVEHVLCDIDDYLRRTDDVSHDDVLQALAIATAVQLAKRSRGNRAGVDFTMELLDIAVDSLPATRTASPTGRSN